MSLGGAADCIPAPGREQGNASARDWFRILRKSGGRHLRDSNPRGGPWTAGWSARAFQLGGLGSRPQGAFRSARVPKKNLAGTNGPAKFEQGGFTSTRRRVRGPLSGRKSRKLVWSKSAPEIRSEQVSRGKNIQLPTTGHNRELVLARLQKPQCYERGVKLRAGRSCRPLPEPPFGHLAQQKIAENADPLR